MIVPRGKQIFLKMKEKVSLVKSVDSYKGTFAALELLRGELDPLIMRAKRPVIKVNFVSADHLLSATPVEAIEAVIDFIRQYSRERILVAETATLGQTEDAWRNYGYQQLEKRDGVELYDLRKDQTLPLQISDRRGNFFTIPYSRLLEDSDFLVSLTRPKTHDTVVVTLTGKNIAVGGIVGERSKIHQGRKIHKNLLRILAKVKPHLAVLDGTLGMEGDGPVFGTEIKAGWAAASTDWLSIDTLGTYLMGENLEKVGYLHLAAQRRMGRVFPGEVEVIGEDPGFLRKHFQHSPSYAAQIRWNEPDSRIEEFKLRLIRGIKRFF